MTCRGQQADNHNGGSCSERAAHHSASHALDFGKLPDVAADLVDELAGWGHNQAHGAVARLQRVLHHDVAQHGQHEGKCLARARLGDADAVAARQDYWYCLCLHTSKHHHVQNV